MLHPPTSRRGEPEKTASCSSTSCTTTPLLSGPAQHPLLIPFILHHVWLRCTWIPYQKTFLSRLSCRAAALRDPIRAADISWLGSVDYCISQLHGLHIFLLIICALLAFFVFDRTHKSSAWICATILSENHTIPIIRFQPSSSTSTLSCVTCMIDLLWHLV